VTLHRALAAVGTTGIVLVATGSASAYLTAHATGTGSGSATAERTITVSVPTAPTGLLPGDRADLTVGLANPGGSDVHVASITLDAIASSDEAACPAGTLRFTASASPSAEGWTVPAGGSIDVPLADALRLAADAPSACQGTTFTVTLRAA
jgi:hypothetical protein